MNTQKHKDLLNDLLEGRITQEEFQAQCNAMKENANLDIPKAEDDINDELYAMGEE